MHATHTLTRTERCPACPEFRGGSVSIQSEWSEEAARVQLQINRSCRRHPTPSSFSSSSSSPSPPPTLSFDRPRSFLLPLRSSVATSIRITLPSNVRICIRSRRQPGFLLRAQRKPAISFHALACTSFAEHFQIDFCSFRSLYLTLCRHTSPITFSVKRTTLFQDGHVYFQTALWPFRQEGDA